jgi:ABC-type glutathione transport system ATPase component
MTHSERWRDDLFSDEYHDKTNANGLTVAAQTGAVAGAPVSIAGAVLQAANLTRRFGERMAVDDVSFHVGPGETYGLLGPNGAGKTTTIRLVCGLLTADAGTVRVAGMPVSTSATRPRGGLPPPHRHGAEGVSHGCCPGHSAQGSAATAA